jgi:hypothetical protein
LLNLGVVALLLKLILLILLLLGNYQLLASRGLRLIAGRGDGLENFIWRERKLG